MIGALILGFLAGFIGRALMPNDVFAGMRGPKSWGISILLGLVGAFVGRRTSVGTGSGTA